MQNSGTCPECGTPLPGGALTGLCPACLLKQGATQETDVGSAKVAFEPPSVEEIKRLFPQLEILSFLGKGGMGAVYKARQPALDRMVALKILPAQVASGPGFAERFNQEARALARLDHPSIVGIYDFGQAGPMPYFVMEYVDGANLRQMLKAQRLSPREALQIVPQICDALQYAHDEGIVHRDIKPENVLVDRKGRVKIADFGLAKIAGHRADTARLTAEGQVMGTPHYMAPEQLERPLAVDHRADIYSLGVVFYEMLTGELPLGKFPPPSSKASVDGRLDGVVARTLEKEPDRRYQKAGEVKTDVENIAQTPPKTESPAVKGPPVAETKVVPTTPATMTKKTKHDLTAPLLVALIVHLLAFMAPVVVLVKVAPAFMSIMKDLGVGLPVMTRVTLQTSEILKNFWFIILPMVFGLDFLISYLLLRYGGRRFLFWWSAVLVSGLLTVSALASVSLFRPLIGVTQQLGSDASKAHPANEAGIAPATVNSTDGGDNDTAGIVAESRFASGDTNKTYFLIHKASDTSPPARGYRLLLVFSGGDGGADFRPFLKRVCSQALPPGYLVAQLVAPKWDEKQFQSLVWPTANHPYPAMKFSTEEFAAAVVADIFKTHRVDAAHIYVLGWSSGGPAAYAVSLHPAAQIKGSFVAMSVIWPDKLPALKTAQGKAYYLLHSPQDFIPMTMPEKARELFAGAGARVHLETYPGGHGWHGDVFGTIRKGIEWLEQDAPAKEDGPSQRPHQSPAAAGALVEALKGSYGAAYLALMEKNDAQTALASLETALPRMEELQAMVRGTAAEVPVAAGVDQVRLVISALKEGKTDQAKTIMRGLDIAGPGLEKLVKGLERNGPPKASP